MPVQLWRTAATLVLAIKQAPGLPPKYLMMKRSSGHKFMPNLHVFPGGKLEPADYSPSWLPIFGLPLPTDIRHGGATGQLLEPRGLGDLLARFPAGGKYSSCLPKLEGLALRICAIREAFEECGVLLARPAIELAAGDGHPALHPCITPSTDPNDKRTLSSRLGRLVDRSDLAAWQKIVAKDAGKFLDMCQELEVVPDVGALSEWSNWLTPIAIESSRYDTWFFVVGVDRMPSLEADAFEVADVQVKTAAEFVQSFREGTCGLAPPQVYELARLQTFSSLDSLLDVSLSRQVRGLGLYKLLPVRIQCPDAIIMALPGDDMYPSCPDVIGEYPTLSTELTLAQCQAIYPVYHRTVRCLDTGHIEIHVNMPHDRDAVLPATRGFSKL